MVKSKGLRYNKGKLRWSLLPYDSLKYIIEVFEHGAKKYNDRNWEKGLSYSDTYDCAMRHLTAWFLREDNDTESGLKHLAHAAWNCLALLTFELRNVGVDDRPKIKEKNDNNNSRSST